MSLPRLSFLLVLAVVVLDTAAGSDWSLLRLLPKAQQDLRKKLKLNIKNYCDGWRFNVEVNNIRGFDGVPDECGDLIAAYLSGGQYEADVLRALEEATVYLNDNVRLDNSGKEAWVFDVDETLLSSVPFFLANSFGGWANQTELDQWLAEGKAPALKYSLLFYNIVKSRGVKIYLLSSRREHLRSATVDNLVKSGFHGWSGLYLRPDDGKQSAGSFKASQRQKLEEEGYRVWAVVSSQWSSLFGSPSPLRIFKLPNPIYYEY